MATWKKVITSGSQAELQTLAVDNTFTINADNFQFTGSVRISGSAAIPAAIITGSVTITGSLFATASQAITASYALNAVASSFPLTNGEGISTFSFNGSAAQTVSVSGAADLTQNIITKWDNNANKFANSSLTDNGTTISGATSIALTGVNSSLSGSFSGSFTGLATSASIAGRTTAALTPGAGLTGTNATFNGSAATTFDVGSGALITVNADNIQVATSSLATNQIPKFNNNTLSGSNISDTGTQVQIGSGATSGLSVAAGGISVTGNSTFNNNLTVAGDLTVAGTASFQNTQNLLIGDRFAAFASGSTSLTDGGIIIVSSTGAGGMSGSALFLESFNTSTYGRFATQYNVHVSASSTVTADEFVVTAKFSANSAPSAAPTWGGTSNGYGNMWIKDDTGDIFIYA